MNFGQQYYTTKTCNYMNFGEYSKQVTKDFEIQEYQYEKFQFKKVVKS